MEHPDELTTKSSSSNISPATGETQSQSKPRPSQIVLPPTLSQNFVDFEYSVHVPPKSFLRELVSVFPGVLISEKSPTALLVVPTFQRAAVPLLEYGDTQAVEKDRLLERFFIWCQRVRDAIKKLAPDAWVDATDPASGTAWKGNAGSCYSDVDGIIRLLRYETFDVGCRVAAHPKWRFAVYPATLFTMAPHDVVIKALDQVNFGQA